MARVEGTPRNAVMKVIAHKELVGHQQARNDLFRIFNKFFLTDRP
jgi:hypothetical protein